MAKGNKALYLSGQDIFIPECNIKLRQPRLKDIAVFGEDQFLVAAQLFGKTEIFTTPLKEGNPMLSEFSDFQLLLVMIFQQSDLRDSMQTFFELVFPDYKVSYGDGTINFEFDGQIVGQIQVFNFDAFSKVIKEIFIPVLGDQEEEIVYDPVNDKAKEIADKIKRGRAKVAEIKNGPQDDSSLIARLTSSLSIGLAMDINILFNYTMYQLCDVFNRYLLKTKYDFYMKVSTTPLMDTSKLEEPKEWLGNL